MGGAIKARYENKVLKPLGELDLKEGDEVEIKVRGSATCRIFGIVKCWEGLEEAHEDYETNVLVIDPRNWKPTVIHDDVEWNFWEAGSGGKKTLFNVCYALAIHSVALGRNMPVPDILIIDSPTKNISEDENPELVQSLYAEIYGLARGYIGYPLQFLLIDSDLVAPSAELPGFSEHRMAGEPDAPSLIPYYTGP